MTNPSPRALAAAALAAAITMGSCSDDASIAPPGGGVASGSAGADGDAASGAAGQGTGGGGADAGTAGAGAAGLGGDAGSGGALAGSGGGPAGTGAGGGGTGGTAGAGAGSGGAAGASPDAGPHVPICQMSCSSPNDCATTGGFPASEYACTAEKTCSYTGCTSDAVCAAVYKSSAYVCRPSPFGATKLCAKTCQKPADCASDNGAYSSDNYTCKIDYCVYTGCVDDQECKTTMVGLGYRCVWHEGLGYKTCQKGCASASDCAVPSSPAYAASTWNCSQGACQYLGCPSDSACQQSMQSPSYVCR